VLRAILAAKKRKLRTRLAAAIIAVLFHPAMRGDAVVAAGASAGVALVWDEDRLRALLADAQHPLLAAVSAGRSPPEYSGFRR
jgi:hypothetical protein